MPNGTIDPQHDYVTALDQAAATRWPSLAAARVDAISVHNLLHNALRQFTSDDVDVVVFGSLARREWTVGSDVDWTLLIDGQARSEHRSAAREVDRTLHDLSFKGSALKDPGAEGIFGSMAFSHDIVHHIGGQADTNKNTTQRILLLTEAVALRDSENNLGPCERIIRQILNRYLTSDSNFHSKTDQESRIPRFLMNDVVRYWRTMCVDFAYKDWEQGGRKWALRNVKLRMSRKILFFSSLLTIFSCFNNRSLRRNGDSNEAYLLSIQAHLLAYVHSTPLNIVSWALSDIGLRQNCCELLDIYEQFMTLLNTKDARDHLESLSQDVYSDPRFLECRDLSHQLQKKLTHICFGADSPLRSFMTEYGVF